MLTGTGCTANSSRAHRPAQLIPLPGDASGYPEAGIAVAQTNQRRRGPLRLDRLYLSSAATNVEEAAPAQAAVLPQPAPASLPQPVQMPLTSLPLHPAATAESDVERPRATVTLVPLANVIDIGETMTQPQAARHCPTALDREHSRLWPPPPSPPEPVVMPAATNTDVGRPATIAPEILREALAASLAEALFLEREEVALDKPFIDMGLDSIVAAEWVRALNTRYGINITVSRVYDYPNIIDLPRSWTRCWRRG